MECTRFLSCLSAGWWWKQYKSACWFFVDEIRRLEQLAENCRYLHVGENLQLSKPWYNVMVGWKYPMHHICGILSAGNASHGIAAPPEHVSMFHAFPTAAPPLLGTASFRHKTLGVPPTNSHFASSAALSTALNTSKTDERAISQNEDGYISSESSEGLDDSLDEVFQENDAGEWLLIACLSGCATPSQLIFSLKRVRQLANDLVQSMNGCVYFGVTCCT